MFLTTILIARNIIVKSRYEYCFEFRYLKIKIRKIHYIDENHADVAYVYRKLVPSLVNSGYRCVVPVNKSTHIADTSGMG